MKKILFVLLLIPFFGVGQVQIPKGANTIIIQTSDSSHIALKKLARAYVDAGFSVANADKELGSINSNPKVIKSSTCTINASVIEGVNPKIILTGHFQFGYSQMVVGSNPTFPITFKGMKGSEYMNTWEQMQKVALSYPDATLTYEKR